MSYYSSNLSVRASLNRGPPFINATGGTITEDGNFRVHTFTSPGTFTIISNPDDRDVDILVVAGGGAGGDSNAPSGSARGGGGGAGGFRYWQGRLVPAGSYPIVVGAGS